MGSKVSGLFRKVWDVEDFEESDSSSPDNKINRLLKNCGGSIFILKRVRCAMIEIKEYFNCELYNICPLIMSVTVSVLCTYLTLKCYLL